MNAFFQSLWSLLPYAVYSLMTLILSVSLAFALLIMFNRQPIDTIFVIVPSMNATEHLSELLLVLLPMGFVYFFSSFLFAYEVARAIPDIRETIFIPCFVVPFAFLIYAQIGMFYSFVIGKGVKLFGTDYDLALRSIVLALACFFCLEVFMGVARAWSAIDAKPKSPRMRPTGPAVLGGGGDRFSRK